MMRTIENGFNISKNEKITLLEKTENNYRKLSTNQIIKKASTITIIIEVLKSIGKSFTETQISKTLNKILSLNQDEQDKLKKIYRSNPFL